jgi:MFS family permease
VSAAPGTTAAEGEPHPSQSALMRQRRFAPFFWTQFSGAANDNLFKFAFTVMVTYQLQLAWLPPALAGLVIGAVFILPFVLFSATSGQLADKFEKSRMMRAVKNLELAIMAVAAAGFLLPAPNLQAALLLACTFFMGLHSTVFGPLKYALLPQVLKERELTGGNGLVEMGTFVAILVGNLVGGVLISLPGVGPIAVAAGCLLTALLGRLAVQFVPLLPATDPGLTINWNPLTETWRNLRLAREDGVVFSTLLGISWLWFFGAVFLSQFPVFAKDVLHGRESVASLLLVVFSLGIAGGSLLCGRLSRGQLETALVPLGALGMSVFTLDLYWACRDLPASDPLGAWAFLAQPAHWRILADLGLLSASAGLFSVPLYALMQVRSPATHRARLVAANNILNALFMIASSLLAGALLSAGLSIPELFLALGLANLAMLAWLCVRMPEMVQRLGRWGRGG